MADFIVWLGSLEGAVIWGAGCLLAMVGTMAFCDWMGSR